MPVFNYQATDSSGKRVDGNVSAKSEKEAIGVMRDRDLTIIKIELAPGEGNSIFESDFFTGKVSSQNAKASETDLILFTRQLATMVSAGIPLLECLEILADQVDNVGFQAVLHEVVSDVRGGTDFSSSLEKFSPRCFPDIYVNMMKAGEVSGQLDEILVRLAEYLESAAALKAKIKSAMTYPVISIIMILGITIFLLVFIIPKFQSIFASLKIDLPFITVALLAVADFMATKYLYWGGGSILFIGAFVTYKKTPMGQLHMDWLSLNLPVFGQLFKKVAISRFARTFATLIQSGVPILGALQIVASTAGNRIIENIIMEATESVRQGDNLATPLANSPHIFPPMVTKMIAIGEKSGALEQLLMKISEFYDQQVETMVDQLTALIEPLMIGVMGFMVGSMVLAIFLPILKVQQALS